MIAKTLSISSLTLRSLLSFTNAEQHSNATGTFSFSNYPLAQNSTALTGSWTWTYEVNDTRIGNDFKLEQAYSLMIPKENASNKGAPPSTLCIHLFHTYLHNATDYVRDENGDCLQSMSLACIKALKAPLTSPSDDKPELGSNENVTSSCTGIFPSEIPSACEPYFNKTTDFGTKSDTAGLQLYQDFTTQLGTPDGPLGGFQTDAPLAIRQSTILNGADIAAKVYQMSIKKITPILMRTVENGTVGEAKLVCVRQTKVRDGSVPEEPPATTTPAAPKPSNGASAADGLSRAALLSVVIVAIGFSFF